MYESDPSGDTAISMAESGQLTVYMMACGIEVESVEISVATDVPGGVPKAERFFLEGPQSGYVELALPESTTDESKILSDIAADPELPFWVTPITFEGESEEPRFVPPLNGITVSEIQAFPVDSLLVEHYEAGSHGPTPLEEVSREQFVEGKLVECGAL